jgi:hypothetical protein
LAFVGIKLECLVQTAGENLQKVVKFEKKNALNFDSLLAN